MFKWWQSKQAAWGEIIVSIAIGGLATYLNPIIGIPLFIIMLIIGVWLLTKAYKREVATKEELKETKTNYVNKIIIDSKSKDLLAIPDALQELRDLDIKLFNKLSHRKVSRGKLIKIQSQLRSDWEIKPSETYDNLSRQMIKDIINQTVKRLNLSYTEATEDTMLFMINIAGVLDDNGVGLSKLREADERFNLIIKLKAKISTQKLINAIRVYTWYSLGINSILLLTVYFPAQSVQSVMKTLGKTDTELKAERDQTLSFLLTVVNKLIEEELHGEAK
jgi:hypothetical protein